MGDIVRETGQRYRNWGKWGPDDERGTLNYITPETIVQAAGLVRRGAVFSLAIPFDSQGPQVNQPRRFNPIHRMILTGPDFTTEAVKRPGGVGFADDMVIMPLQCATQWDALSHCFLDGHLYNGYDANLVSSEGAKKNGIEKIARGVVARGVLLDIPRVKGVDWLEPAYAITVADLDGGDQRVTGELRPLGPELGKHRRGQGGDDLAQPEGAAQDLPEEDQAGEGEEGGNVAPGPVGHRVT